MINIKELKVLVQNLIYCIKSDGYRYNLWKDSSIGLRLRLTNREEYDRLYSEVVADYENGEYK